MGHGTDLLGDSLGNTNNVDMMGGDVNNNGNSNSNGKTNNNSFGDFGDDPFGSASTSDPFGLGGAEPRREKVAPALTAGESGFEDISLFLYYKRCGGVLIHVRGLMY